LLSQGLCRSLTLADVNPRAVEAAQATIDHNDLAGTVDVYLSDCFDAIPSEEKWDLVVGNPPHFGSAAILPVERSLAKPEIIYQDAGWRIHQKFYDQVGAHLNGGASIVLVENGNYSGPELFRPMIEASPHLTWVEAIDAPPMFFLVWSRRESGDR
jgi:methylase of polypeptide subunit release factors